MSAQPKVTSRPSGADALWSIVLRPGQIGERELWHALIDGFASGEHQLDYRSRLLAHDALEALAQRWGTDSLRSRLSAVEEGDRLERLWQESFEEVGFASLRDRIVQTTAPDSILQLLRELGARLRQPARVIVGGSSSLLLADLVVRKTEDIDLVDEVPQAIRAQPELIDELARRYGLRLTHFASHYLPDGWEGRASSLGNFGKLDVRVLDPLDVLCGKLFSRRTKDLDDLRFALPKLDQAALRARLGSSTARLRADAALADAAAENWFVLTGESRLPVAKNRA